MLRDWLQHHVPRDWQAAPATRLLGIFAQHVRVLRRVVLLIGLGMLMVGCGGLSGVFVNPSPEITVPPSSAVMNIESPAFQANHTIPTEYTCDGVDQSPPLQWSEVPPEAQSLTLIMDDPDAPRGTFVHWVVYDLPADGDGLAEAIPAGESIPGGGVQGINDFRAIAYGGPCPPRGTHRYLFKLYALDTQLNLPPGVSKADVIAAMDGHILGFAELIGLYSRS